MEVSFLIVTKNRPTELDLTLQKLKALVDLKIHEVLVYIDGCVATEALIAKYPWVIWDSSTKSLGASPARNFLYKKASGSVFIGLDDDAHPLSNDFIVAVEREYLDNKKLGIIAFQEVRGIFDTDEKALENANFNQNSHLTNDFVGCGFAISKEAYFSTRGFPTWIDIYGEESCLAIEVLENNYDILYQPKIIVNHRVDVQKRLLAGRNYFRFEKQLKNTFKYYLAYYQNPTFKIAKMLHHNFMKYGLQDFRYFRLFFKSVFSVLIGLPKLPAYRKPISKATFLKMKKLKGLHY